MNAYDIVQRTKEMLGFAEFDKSDRFVLPVP